YRHGRWHLFASTDPHTLNPRWRAPSGSMGLATANRLFHWTSSTRSILGPYVVSNEMYPGGYTAGLGSEHTGLFWTMLVSRMPWRPFTNSTEKSELQFLRAERRRERDERKRLRREEANAFAEERESQRRGKDEHGRGGRSGGNPEETDSDSEQIEAETAAAIAAADPAVLADLEEVGREQRGRQWRRRRLLADRGFQPEDLALAADLVDRELGVAPDAPIFAVGAYRLGDAEGESRQVRLDVHGTIELSGRFTLLWPSGGVPPQIQGTPPYGKSLAAQAAAYRDLTSEG
ncbi:MAG: hypothetical protein VXW17_02575, partial [Pseudomonadota bacterium]|nr:hypothetical protein [Pseudomonadota bacterium]